MAKKKKRYLTRQDALDNPMSFGKPSIDGVWGDAVMNHLRTVSPDIAYAVEAMSRKKPTTRWGSDVGGAGGSPDTSGGNSGNDNESDHETHGTFSAENDNQVAGTQDSADSSSWGDEGSLEDGQEINSDGDTITTQGFQNFQAGKEPERISIDQKTGMHTAHYSDGTIHTYDPNQYNGNYDDTLGDETDQGGGNDGEGLKPGEKETTTADLNPFENATSEDYENLGFKPVFDLSNWSVSEPEADIMSSDYDVTNPPSYTQEDVTDEGPTVEPTEDVVTGGKPDPLEETTTGGVNISDPMPDGEVDFSDNKPNETTVSGGIDNIDNSNTEYDANVEAVKDNISNLENVTDAQVEAWMKKNNLEMYEDFQKVKNQTYEWSDFKAKYDNFLGFLGYSYKKAEKYFTETSMLNQAKHQMQLAMLKDAGYTDEEIADYRDSVAPDPHDPEGSGADTEVEQPENTTETIFDMTTPNDEESNNGKLGYQDVIDEITSTPEWQEYQDTINSNTQHFTNAMLDNKNDWEDFVDWAESTGASIDSDIQDMMNHAHSDYTAWEDKAQGLYDDGKKFFGGVIDEYDKNLASIPGLNMKLPGNMGGGSVPLAPNAWNKYYGDIANNKTDMGYKGFNSLLDNLDSQRSGLDSQYNIYNQGFNNKIHNFANTGNMQSTGLANQGEILNQAFLANQQTAQAGLKPLEWAQVIAAQNNAGDNNLSYAQAMQPDSPSLEELVGFNLATSETGQNFIYDIIKGVAGGWW